MSTYALGIDLGGSSVKATAVSLRGQILSREILTFDAQQEMHWALIVRDLARQVQIERGEVPASIGLSAPGLAASDQRSIAYMPGRLHGLEGLNWADYLQAPSPVPVLNDAHAALLGEAWIGAAAGLKNVFMLTLGTGVGGAAIVDGKLLLGHLGRAGHLGHICLDQHGVPDITRIPGSLEYFIGNYSIQERSHGRFASTHQLLAAHAAGEPEATQIWSNSIRALGCAIASLVNILDPEAVIVGGGIAGAGRSLFDPLIKELDQVEWRPGGHQVRILPAKLGEFAGAIGAAYCGAQRLRGKPAGTEPTS